MLLRGQNLVGYKHYSDEIVDRFVKASHRNGIDVFRVFDALNDIRNVAPSAVAIKEAGAHFVAITDAGTRLDELAQRLGFRDIFRNDPTVGGRYSALTYFGMVAAALLGMDARAYLKRAIAMADECHVSENPATRLGTVMGVLANTGRDKLTLILSPSIAPFGDWVEQLVAETTGKEGKGILPVLGEKVAERPPERFLPGSSPSEPQGVPDVYGDDRLFVALTMRDDHTLDARLDALVKAGEPVVRYELANLYDLGAHMFLWELATAVAGYHLHINPFNQPNVESAKQRAREMMDAYRERGELPALEPALEDGGVKVYGDVSARSAPEALRAFVQHAQPGGYIALQAYVQPSEGTTRVLHELQARLRAATGQAVTVGYGPRFLHSTGQLHKGDAGKGLFVQFLGSGEPDVPIPDEPGSAASSITFGVLRTAQALGDRQALLDAGRRVLTFDLDDTVREELRRLDAAL